MVGDNDAGGVATYSQAGQNYGTSLLWVLLLLIPVLIVNQEMVVRLGRGHRGRSRPADQRALRALLGLVLGRRPVPAQLPDDRHRVHRRQPRARLLRRLEVHRGPDRRRGAGRDHRQRQLPPLGARRCSCSCSRTCWSIPLFFMAHPQHRATSPTHFVVPGDPRRRELDLGAADHRASSARRSRPGSCSSSSRTSSTSGSRRAGSTTSGSTRGSARFVVVLGAAALICGLRLRLPAHPVLRPLHRRRAAPPAGSSHGSARSPARSSRSSCSTRR